MRCDEARERLLYGASDEGHLEACSACAAFANDTRRLHDVLGEMIEAPPERVWEAVAPRRASRLFHHLATAAGFAAIAGALLWRAPAPVSAPPPSPALAAPAAAAAAPVQRDIDSDIESARAEIEWLDHDIQRF